MCAFIAYVGRLLQNKALLVSCSYFIARSEIFMLKVLPILHTRTKKERNCHGHRVSIKWKRDAVMADLLRSGRHMKATVSKTRVRKERERKEREEERELHENFITSSIAMVKRLKRDGALLFWVGYAFRIAIGQPPYVLCCIGKFPVSRGVKDFFNSASFPTHIFFSTTWFIKRCFD